MHKKGEQQALNAIIIIVIALIVFVPSCIKASELFRISAQAKDNFANFVTALNKLNQEGKIEQIESEVLILDKETAVVFFQPKFPDVTVSAAGESYYFKRPQACEPDKNCMCLFQEVKTDGAYLLPKTAICYHLDFAAAINSCTPVGYEDGEVSCQNGFFIAREIEDFGLYRRIAVNLIKQEGQVLIVPNN